MGTDKTKLVHPGESFNQCIDSYREQLHQLSIAIRLDIQTADQNKIMHEDFSELQKILKYCWPNNPTPQTYSGFSVWNPISRLSYLGPAFNQAVCESYETYQWANCFADISASATISQTKAFLEEMSYVDREMNYESYKRVAILIWLAATHRSDWKVSVEEIKGIKMIWLINDLKVVFSNSGVTNISDILQKTYGTLNEKAKEEFLALLSKEAPKSVEVAGSMRQPKLNPEATIWLRRIQAQNAFKKM